MNIVGKELLESFARSHRDAQAQFDAWVDEVESAEWKTTHDIRARYPSASFVGDNRVIFNIRGN